MRVSVPAHSRPHCRLHEGRLILTVMVLSGTGIREIRRIMDSRESNVLMVEVVPDTAVCI